MYITSVSCDTADRHKKMNTVNTGGTTKIKFFRFFLVFVTKKCVKTLTLLSLIFNKRIIYRK